MRFRDFGFDPGMLPTGSRNKISDVDGVTVGHRSRTEGQTIRTGVTVIDSGMPDLYHNKLPAAVAVGNGFGKMAGETQINELGTLESPIALTNTLAIGPAMQWVIELVIATTTKMPGSATVNAVVGETSDGILNDIQRIVIEPGDVRKAYDARSADFALGAVGAGTGTCCFGFKGGIGSASRKLSAAGQTWTLGALLQTNFGGALTILGVPVGRLLGKTEFDSFVPADDQGSCMIVLATDAPLSSRQLGRVARRAMLGLGRTGSVMGHGSGDYAIAFSTSRAGVEGSGSGDCLPDSVLNALFLGAVETVEESVYDSLFTSETITGRDGNTLEQIPVEQVVQLLKSRGL